MNEVEKCFYVTRNFVNYTDLEIKRIRFGCRGTTNENQEVHKNLGWGDVL
jgi:hypothetical protein